MREIRVEVEGIIITIILYGETEQQSPVQVQCSDCGWTRQYPNPKIAKRGLAAHQAHCPGPHEEVDRVRRIMGFDRDQE